MSIPPVPDAPPPPPDPSHDRTGAARWESAPPPPPEPQWSGQAAYKMSGPPPPNNLALAVVATLVFFPIGLFALFKAASVSDLWHSGQTHRAVDAAQSAKTISLVVIIGGVMLWAAGLVFALSVSALVAL